jgi:hypothetical protein
LRLLMGLIFVALFFASANAQSIRVEAESYIYVAYHDEGGVALNVVSCSGASGGQAVEGFDFPGDWIEVILEVPENGSFCDSLRSGGLTAHECDLQSTVFGAGPLGEDLVSAFHTIGEGIG